MNTEVIDQECYGAMTFMNLSGDIKNKYDKNNRTFWTTFW